MGHQVCMRACVVREGKQTLIAFAEGLKTVYIPDGILRGARCRLKRGGKCVNDPDTWNPRRRGIIAGELNDGDNLEFEDCPGLLLALYAWNEDNVSDGNDSLIIWVDTDLRDALHRGYLLQSAA